MFKSTDYNYGMTCPLLLIANEHDEDYGVVLGIADYIIHGRSIDHRILDKVSNSAMAKIVLHSMRFDALRDGH